MGEPAHKPSGNAARVGSRGRRASSRQHNHQEA